MSFEDRYLEQQKALAEQKAALRKTAEFQQELKKIDRRELSRKSEIDLTVWQTSYPPDSPQFLIADKEWERRLSAEQIKAGHIAAWIGVGGTIVGSLLSFCLGWWLSAHQIHMEQNNDDHPHHETGSTSNPDNGILHVIASNFRSPKIERELKYYVANFSTYSTNHFYVGATELNGGKLVTALVYWKEARIIMPYGELTDDAPSGAEIFAWQGDHLKLARDTVDTPEDIAGSTYLETDRQWVDWMEQCISNGRSYVITLNEATNLYPQADRTNADDE